LNYEGFTNLMEHTDGYATSVVLNVMLTSTDDYEGGEFYIQDTSQRAQIIRPGQYSALAFLGGRFVHGVETIHSGKREALSTEYWYYPDLPFGVNLCAADFRNIEEHIRKCNQVQWNSTAQSYDYGHIPCKNEFPSESVYGVCHSQLGTVPGRAVYDEL
jgi:hypothetical protein